MNTQDLQQLKMAWIAAHEAGDTQQQISLLRNNPDAQTALIDFAAAFYATEVTGTESEALLPLTQRASKKALARAFANQAVAANLRELRNHRGFTLLSTAQGLRLGVDVWKKFEDGAIELLSLSDRQLERLATFFQVSAEQFSTLLTNSQPAMGMHRRQTKEAARAQQGQKKQSFREALEKSTMDKEAKHFWQEQ